MKMGFGASQVLGIAIGLYLANQWGWQFPFIMIAGLAFVIWFVIILKMKPVNKHLLVPAEPSAYNKGWEAFKVKFVSCNYLFVCYAVQSIVLNIFEVNVPPIWLYINLMNKNLAFKKTFLLIVAALGWFAIIAQLYLIILNRTASIAETITRFFSFFTILTNILVALCLTFLIIKPGSALGRFFEKTATQSALAVYIVVVGIIYNVILRFLWNPQGLQRIVDEILHTVVPVLFVVYWYMFVNKKTIGWNIFPWLIYPLLYCIYTLIRGAVVGFYPYPFMDAGDLGYNKVILNIAGMVALFVVVSLLLVAISKLTKRTLKNKNS